MLADMFHVASLAPHPYCLFGGMLPTRYRHAQNHAGEKLTGGVTEPPRLARGRGKGTCPHRGQRHRRCPCPADSDPTHRLARTATRVYYLLHRCRMLKCIYMKACRYISQVYPGISQVYQFWKQPPRTCEGPPSISYVHQVLVPWQRVAHIYPKRPTVYHA